MPKLQQTAPPQPLNLKSSRDSFCLVVAARAPCGRDGRALTAEVYCLYFKSRHNARSENKPLKPRIANIGALAAFDSALSEPGPYRPDLSMPRLRGVAIFLFFLSLLIILDIFVTPSPRLRGEGRASDNHTIAFCPRGESGEKC